MISGRREPWRYDDVPVHRLLPTPEARDLLDLVGEIAERELRPAAGAAEEAGRFPRDTIRTLGRAGLLGLPYDDEFGRLPRSVFFQD